MSVIISDDCTGANGTDVNGRTPDTTNTPGNAYVSTANTYECNGSGDFKTTGAGTQFRINTGVVDQKLTVVWTMNGANNRLNTFTRTPNDTVGSGTFDGYNLVIEADADQFRVFKYVNGATTQLGSTTAYPAFNNSSNFAMGMQSQGSTHKVFIDGVEVFSASDAAVDGVTVGGTYVHVFHGLYNSTGGLIRSLEVDNLVVAGGFRSRIAGGLVIAA